MVALYKEQFGRGPTHARSHFAGPDAIICLLEETLTPVERTLVRIGEHQRLRDIRMLFQYTAEDAFRGVVEEITGRRVVAFTSGFDATADVASEVFVLAPSAGPGRGARHAPVAVPRATGYRRRLTTAPATQEIRMSQPHPVEDADAKRLGELGYTQEFDRRWSGFSNFAISFSIISILSGCFTTFGQAWNNGGPIAISLGWPVIAGFILIIGLCMSELVSSFPTAGGIYYWAFRLGKPRDAWLTGWLNLTGLVAVIAGVDYGFAYFFVTTAGLYNSWWDNTDLTLIFCVFLVTAVIHVMMNVYGARVIHRLQTINVYWHVFGVVAIVLILFLVPGHHQSASFVFTHRINNSGFPSGMFWFYVLPLGFLLTQYTITGFDASAHVSEETAGASNAAARGLWQSIAYSAIGGWILLLALLFAATHVKEITAAGGFSPVILDDGDVLVLGQDDPDHLRASGSSSAA